MTRPCPLPKGLIYHTKGKDEYRLIDIAARKLVGRMTAFDIDVQYDKFYKLKPGQKIFHIFTLEIEQFCQNNGWGSYFIDFAKKESYKRNCEGRVSLVSYNYDNPPHTFYKKQGFITIDKRTNKELDYCLKCGVRSCLREDLNMYLPVDTTENTMQNSEIEKASNGKIWKILKRIVGIDKNSKKE